MITLYEQVKSALLHSNMTLAELAKQFGISASGMTQRLKNGKFTKQELQKIAHILGCDYVSYFQYPDGKRY